MTCAALLALANPALAQTSDMPAGRELAETVFASIGNDPNGRIDMGEFTEFGRLIFASMDHDENAAVDAGEFTTWDFGYNIIADDTGQSRAYETAQKILFAFWDRDGDGAISRSEFHQSMVWDFRRADVDDDAFLTKGEFLRGYVVNTAYRAALTGR